MKKKIIAICLCVALVAVGIVGATLAYFTDKDQVKNTFEVGNVDIDLYEYIDDARREDEKYQEHVWYSQIMPGDEMVKIPVIKNTGAYDAYVRVAVVMNNLNAINEAIDDVYEAKGYTDEQIQAVYDNVFEEWGVNYNRRAGYPDSRRMWMDNRDEPVLFNIDTYAQLESYGMYDINNKFQSDIEKLRTAESNDGFIYGDDVGYYSCIENDERIYVFYLKLAPGAKYELFTGLNVPADFNEAQMAMFEGLEIGIYADAIQVANFDTAVDAFNALQEANPLGWWKSAD